ncbi:MAG TPA: DNA polymerase III subunit alpha [Armatimonadetes bacterium]|nr:DNA polymerase III subunit alpha [Armatimonadota bacterium]
MGEGKRFVHLHVHSEYSPLDGACRISDLVNMAASYDMPALAITDHGALYGTVKFYKACKEAGIKPIIGCELCVTPGSRYDRSGKPESFLRHLVVLVENEKGWRNLIKLTTRAFLEGFYYKPRADYELLAEHAEGLICLTSCLQGEVPQLILQRRVDDAELSIRRLQDIFGKENVYLEVMRVGMEEQEVVNQALFALSERTGAKLVATNDVHYLRPEDAEAHDVLLCIQTGSKVDERGRFRFRSQEFYFRSPEEMANLFRDRPDAIENTIEIAERCHLDIDFGSLYLPPFDIPPEFPDHDAYLEHLCRQNLRKRFPKVTPEIEERLRYELKVIREKGFAPCFLVVWDLLREARQRGIPVGPGRGSAAGSLVAYLLEITHVDPLKHGLLFERFLNPERGDMPDIDLDFCDQRRDEVIAYVRQKYGEDRVAQIATFGTLASRAAVRDAGRALGVPLDFVDWLAKQIPMGISLAEAMEGIPELRKAYEEDQRARRLLDTALKIEGLVRHVSTHAAGVVISPMPLTERIPLQRSPGGGELPTTQFDKDDIEALGLMKLDILGLRTLTVMRDTLELVKKTRKREVDLTSLPLNDPKAFALLRRGDTAGVFQLESAGMQRLLREASPDTFDELVAIIGLYRPGPLQSGMVEGYIQNKRRGRVSSIHPAIDHILSETRGVVLYQEQVMQIASEIAGYSMAEADTLRRAVSKKKKEVIEEQRKVFIERAVERGIRREDAERIFGIIESFGSYGFNKSHSAVYALLAYWTAYLKANFPREFMAALLTSVQNNKEKLNKYVEECRRMGIEVYPPDVNKSGVDFTVEGEGIRAGLAAIKNVGRQAAEAVVRARERLGPFKDLYDFCEKVDLKQVDKRAIEAMIKVGAFDGICVSRAGAIQEIPSAMDHGQKAKKERQSGQVSLFGAVEAIAKGTTKRPKTVGIPEFSHEEILEFEREYLGFYVTAHPLAKFKELLLRYITATLDQLQDLEHGEEVTVGGRVVDIRRRLTRDQRPMMIFRLEDFKGSAEVVLYPDIFERYSGMVAIGSILVVEGRVSIEEDEGERRAVLVASRVTNVRRLIEGRAKEVEIVLPLDRADSETLRRLKDLLSSHPGEATVFFVVPDKAGGTATRIKAEAVKIKPTLDLLQAVERLLGPGCISIAG